MPIHVHVDVGHRPELDAERLAAILEEGLAGRYEVLQPGRLQVPDAIVKASDREGVAVQILQQRLRRRTRLRVYGLAPSIAQRATTPASLARQVKETGPLLDEVVAVLKSSDALRPPSESG